MKVFINRHEVTIFNGATVGDAIRSYSSRSYRLACNEKLVVLDCFGNKTELDGSLKDGQEIRLMKKIK
jgi:hypothetical protein